MSLPGSAKFHSNDRDARVGSTGHRNTL